MPEALDASATSDDVTMPRRLAATSCPTTGLPRSDMACRAGWFLPLCLRPCSGCDRRRRRVQRDARRARNRPACGPRAEPAQHLVFQRSRLTDLTFAEECGSDADTPIADRGSVAESGVAFLCRIRSIAVIALDRCRLLSMQEASQRLAIVVLGLPGHAGIRCPVEAMIRPRIHVKLDRHPGAAQSIRIGHVFLEEEIKTADRNVG